MIVHLKENSHSATPDWVKIRKTLTFSSKVFHKGRDGEETLLESQREEKIYVTDRLYVSYSTTL